MTETVITEQMFFRLSIHKTPGGDTATVDSTQNRLHRAMEDQYEIEPRHVTTTLANMARQRRTLLLALKDAPTSSTINNIVTEGRPFANKYFG